jgi:hypothetical protein
VCFHTHSGFVRIFLTSFFAPLPQMGHGGVTSASGVDPSVGAFASYAFGNSGLLSRDMGRSPYCFSTILIRCFLPVYPGAQLPLFS